MNRHAAIRHSLTEQLHREHALWSYRDDVRADELPDDILIEKVLVYLDLDDIDKLFLIFPEKKIKQVWRETLVPQQEYYGLLNRFLAWYYFHVKRPDQYLKSMLTRHYHRLTS